MGISDNQRTEINLTRILSNVPEDSKEDAALAIGQDLIDSIKDYLKDGESPVAGYKFKPLNKDYANEKKGGDRTPNLKLEGDLLNSLSAEYEGDTLVIGVSSSQEGKADGHNNFSGDSNLPTRRFLADSGEIFKDQDKIIRDIVPLYEVDVSSALEEVVRAMVEERARVETKINLDDLKEFKAPQAITARKKGSVTIGGLTKKYLEDLFAD
jgi:phage gpG-like protein